MFEQPPGEKDTDHEEKLWAELDAFYRVHYLKFGEEGIKVREYRYRECQSDEQRLLFDKLVWLYKGGIVISVQCLMETVEVCNPLTILMTLENLKTVDLIEGFEFPDPESVEAKKQVLVSVDH